MSKHDGNYRFSVTLVAALLARLRSYEQAVIVAALFIAVLSLPILFDPSLAQSDGGVTEFSTFTFNEKAFTDSPDPFRDRLSLKGAFTLGAGADGIDPLTEEVKVTLTGVGGCPAFSQTIAPGAFEGVGAGFRFRGIVLGELSRIIIQPQGTGGFRLGIQGRRLEFACPLATTLAFIIGNDGGAFDFDTDTQIPLNTPPVADAGPDQTVLLGATVQLDGSGSSDVDGDALTFTWSLTSLPAGSTAALSGPSAIMPSFVADLAGTYVVQLIVNDGQADSAPDTVTITTENSPPVADAGPDQTVAVGAPVQLDGRGSSDVDNDPLTFTWSLTAVPEGSNAVLDDPSAANPSFVADVSGSYTAQLIVHDGTVDSLPDEVVITTENSRPVANAGSDQSATVGQTVQLNGSGSTDADGDPLTFNWSLIAKPDGSSAVLATADLVQSTFVPDLPGDYLAQLIVNDGQLASDPDTAMITVPASLDSDNDGLPDDWELLHFGNLNQGPSDDPDGDGLTNLQELQHGTLPSVADTDGDGMPDGFEVTHGLQPLQNDATADLDGDGLNNLTEYLQGRNPTQGAVPDTTGAVSLKVYTPLE